MELLSTAIINNKNIVSLDLRNNRISGSSASYIYDMIKQSSLKSLDLRWNELDSNCGQGIISALKGNPKLTKLELGGNHFDEGIQLFVEETIRRNIKMGLSEKEITKAMFSPVKTVPDLFILEDDAEKEKLDVPVYIARYNEEAIERERIEKKLNNAEVELGEEREKHVEIREELIKAADAERKVLS